MVVKLLIAFVVPAIVSLLLTPLVIRLAHYLGAIDQPNERKVHAQPIPRLGGIAVSVSFLLSLSMLLIVEPTLLSQWLGSEMKALTLVGSLIMVLILGIWDDIRALKPLPKLIVQVLVSTVIYLGGFRISGITNLFGPGLLNLYVFDYLVTVLWIVGVTNAINLIDGLDGLASGVALIASLTIFPIALLDNDIATAAVALLLGGAVLGFLRYNFNPAKIFLGDSGSLFLGFSLAVLSMQSSTKSSTAFTILVPVLSLGLPIMDTLLSMIRRFLRSFLPEHSNTKTRGLASMFHPDRHHIHHRLLARGLSHRSAVLLLYTISCGLGIGAFVITVANNAEASLVLLVVGIATIVGIRQLRYREMAVLRNGVLLPLFDLPLLNHGMFAVFLDVASIIIAYLLSHLLTDWNFNMTSVPRDLTFRMMLVCTIQFPVLWSRGIYKSTIRHFGLVDALRSAKTVIIAVIVSGTILAILHNDTLNNSLPKLILNFYILLSLVVGTRFSFSLLRHLSRHDPEGPRRTLIYGADQQGIFVLQRMLDGKLADLKPAGFLEDDPRLEGKSLHGMPIFGGHWKLEKLIKKLGIEEILIARERVEPIIMKRLKEIAREQGVVIKRFNVELEEVSLDTLGPHGVRSQLNPQSIASRSQSEGREPSKA